MIRLFLQGGPVMWPLVLITLVLLGIGLRLLWHLFVADGDNCAAVQNGLDGLLFWGGFAVIIGVLGSVLGYHRAMMAVVARGVVNPRAVWLGSAEGLVSSIAGLLVLAGSGALWYFLRLRFLSPGYRRRTES